GVREDMKVGKRKRFDKPKVVVKVAGGLARETRDQVGTDRRRRHRRHNSFDSISEVRDIIAPPHTLQGGVIAGLQRQMQVRTKLIARAYDPQNFIAQLFRVERTQADTADRRSLGDHLEQPLEADRRIEIASIAAEMYAGEYRLTEA